MHQKSSLIYLTLGLTLVACVAQVDIAQCQIFDQLFTSRSGVTNDNLQTNVIQDGTQTNGIPPVFSRLRNMFNVNVPFFYDMVKNGSSMGINVLSGLVRVDRGEEAVRTGLTGPRPLSVRVFGIPVYDRGTRVRNPNDISIPSFGGSGSGANGPPASSGGREAGGDDEELPVY